MATSQDSAHVRAHAHAPRHTSMEIFPITLSSLQKLRGRVFPPVKAKATCTKHMMGHWNSLPTNIPICGKWQALNQAEAATSQ